MSGILQFEEYLFLVFMGNGIDYAGLRVSLMYFKKNWTLNRKLRVS